MAEEKRSRKQAERFARGVLSGGRGTVKDADVLSTLRRWSFRKNQTRKNVRPEGVDHVKSDTLGLVATRDGRVTLSRHTRTDVFRLLAQWLRVHGPSVGKPFPFTSINVNFAYGAALHRDTGNRGPSVSKAFGEYSGGRLVYYPDDDGSMPLEELRLYPTVTLDTQTATCLFDGNRAHSVTSFVGERYSLVFFTQSQYQKAASADLDFLRVNGLGVPTEADLRYFSALLAPAKGYGQGHQLTIRKCLGLEEKLPAMTWKATKIFDIGRDATSLALSFVLAPVCVDVVSAVCRSFDSAVHDPASWMGTRVDATGFRPAGIAAHAHWRLWKRALLVVSASWNYSNVALLFQKNIKCWRWLGQGEYRLLRGHNVLSSQFPVLPTAVSMLVAGRARSPLRICISNTRDPYEILECLDGLPGERRICMAANFGNGPRAAPFSWNGHPLGEGELPLSALYGYVSMSFFVGLLKVTTDGKTKSAVMTGLRLPEDDWFVSIIAPGSVPEVTCIPCWSMD